MYTVFIELPLRCYNECHGKVFVHTNFDVTQKNACGESFMLSASLDIKFVWTNTFAYLVLSLLSARTV